MYIKAAGETERRTGQQSRREDFAHEERHRSRHEDDGTKIRAVARDKEEKVAVDQTGRKEDRRITTKK